MDKTIWTDLLNILYYLTNLLRFIVKISIFDHELCREVLKVTIYLCRDLTIYRCILQFFGRETAKKTSWCSSWSRSILHIGHEVCTQNNFNSLYDTLALFIPNIYFFKKKESRNFVKFRIFLHYLIDRNLGHGVITVLHCLLPVCRDRWWSL